MKQRDVAFTAELEDGGGGCSVHGRLGKPRNEHRPTIPARAAAAPLRWGGDSLVLQLRLRVISQLLQRHFDRCSHARRLRRPSLAGPHYDVAALDARDVQDDTVMLLVVDDAPRIARISV